jgi:predicted TIM-barrel fold metal-dependent hydrolase
MPAATTDRRTLAGGWEGPIIDADLHVNVPSIETLFPYLEPHWVEYVQEVGFATPPALGTKYPPGSAITCAPAWRPADGSAPASDLAVLQADVLDPLAVDYAILNCYWGVDCIRNPDFALALASAINDWLIAEWLDRDDRLRASIVVPAHNPVDAGREIDRVGGHSGFVQVFLPVWSPILYGNRIWLPMFEAIARHGLVAGIHYGGSSEGPPTGTGWPTWFLEEYAGALSAYWSQVLSLVGEGVFRRFPDLRVSLLEGGFAWLPPFLWRIDKEWKGLRREVPWVERLPSAIVRDHVRLSVQPIGAGPPADFRRVVEWLGSDELLMFGSDYPHGHSDTVEKVLDVLPAGAHAPLMAGNARDHYGLGGS